MAQLLEERRRADLARLAAARKRRGAWDGHLCFGYKRVWDGMEDSGRYGRIVVDEKQAPIVRYIFELHDAGASVRAIVARFEDEGILTSKQGLFTPSSIQQILAYRELYTTGRCVYVGIEPSVSWPTILP